MNDERRLVALPSPQDLATRPDRVRELGTITRAMIARFAVSIGDPSPIYFDDDKARAAGHPGIIAPPTFLPAILGWGAGPAESELLADGNDPELVPPEIAGCRMMGGGQALRFGVPVQPGDTVTARKRVVEMRHRRSRSGAPMVLMVTETSYFNQRDELLVCCRETLIALADEAGAP
ncbi:MAG: MaoC family dehydratase N-terminal domain-containing protein [Lautropia sp.]